MPIRPIGIQMRSYILAIAAFSFAVIVFLQPSLGRAQTLQERLTPCLTCHGTNGQSQMPEVPSLGGLPSFYVMAQLYMFRERMRPVEPMSEMLKGVSDDDLRKMADMISALPAPSPDATPADPARMERARALIQRNRCNICHLPNFAGIENVPRLAGQR
jgi:cytochrome c553